MIARRGIEGALRPRLIATVIAGMRCIVLSRPFAPIGRAPYVRLVNALKARPIAQSFAEEGPP
jgi:hypothetical protein